MTETTPERWPAIQGAMDAAYARYQASNPMWTPAQFRAQLSARERAAVTIGNFNYQVCNGGFGQWTGNGYAEPALAELRLIAEQVLAHARSPGAAFERVAAAGEVVALVERFAALARRYGYEEGGDEDDPSLYTAVEEAGLDARFYAVNEVWVDAAEAWLAATFAPDPAPVEV